MTRFLAIAALIATPATAQTITVAKPFTDTNKDGRIDFGTANRKTYGVAYVTGPVGQTSAGYQYCGPRGCDAPSDPFAIAAPVITAKPINLCPVQRWQGGWSLGKDVGNAHITCTMDAVEWLIPSSGPTRLHDFRIDRSREGILAVSKKSPYPTISNVLIERAEMKCAERCLYMRGDSHDWIIRDVKVTITAPNMEKGNIPTGFLIRGTAHDLLFERVESYGWVSGVSGGYVQGDGLTTEDGTYNITIRDSIFRDNSDGGIDSKTINLHLENIKSMRNKYNYRFRQIVRATTLYSENPRNAHIQGNTISTNVIIDKLVAVGGAPLIKFEKPGRIEIKSCDLTRWTGKVKVVGKGTAILGQGC